MHKMRKTFLDGILLIIGLLIFLPRISIADPLDNWHWRNPLPQGNSFNGVAFGNGVFVAVGQLGTIMVSSDGVGWQIRPSGVRDNLSAVAFGNGMFVAVGENGTILISPNGFNWTPGTSVTVNSFYVLSDVTFGAGVFVVTGGDKIFTSSDGVNWTTTTLVQDPNSLAKYVVRIAYGNGIFIAVGGDTRITSTDGINWSVSNCYPYPTEPLSSNFCEGVLYANGIFYLIIDHEGVYGSNYSVILSIDGTNWESTNAGCGDAVTYGNGTFVIVNNGCPSRSRSLFTIPSRSDILTSADGTVWTCNAKTLEDGVFLKGVTFGNGIFVAVGSNGAILTSSDGADWTTIPSWITNINLKGVTHDNGVFVAVGGTGYWNDFASPIDTTRYIILTSTDALVWQISAQGEKQGHLYSVTSGNGMFVAVGGKTEEFEGIILTSPDGANWTSQTSGSGAYAILSSVTYGNGMFVAVGGDHILTSPDGANWTSQTSGLGAYAMLSSVTYGNGAFVAVGYDQTFVADSYDWTTNHIVLKSTDGVSWMTVQSGTTDYLKGVAFGNGIFVAVGTPYDGGYSVHTSPDGTAWQVVTSGEGYQFDGVAYGDGSFVAFGQDGAILTSHDGENWTLRDAIGSINQVTFGNSTFVAVGPGGAILQSDPFWATILWQNQSTGDIVFWRMDGTTLSGQSFIGQVPDTNWEIVGYADFNNDGNPDLLWQNQSSGDINIWLMNGTNVTGSVAAGGVSDPYWRVVSAGDFDGDGKPDYLWQHQQRGDLYTWFIDWNESLGSVVVTGGASSEGVSDPDWKIVGTADFNGDSNTDYLWQHEESGDVYVWYMDDTNPASGVPVPWEGDRAWKIAGVVDFNSDGKPDILWRHPLSGQNYVWFMDGTTVTEGSQIDPVLDHNWKIAGPK